MYARLSVFLFALLLITPQDAASFSATRFEELKGPVTVIRDKDGIPHIYARNEHDLFLMQGYIHARDRFFQMDVLRHQVSGTLAELFGQAVLPQDVELRTIGLRRAAERSLAIISEDLLDVLTAYALGVNLFLMREDLPPEYALLELTKVDPWTPLDSLAIAKLLSFGLSFDLEDIDRTAALMAFEKAGDLFNFDGNALFFEDLYRSAPFDPASTVPDAQKPSAGHGHHHHCGKLRKSPHKPDARTMSLAGEYIKRVRSIPFFECALNRSASAQGSNEWAVSGRFTENGRPLLANDPHLALGIPATFYQNHLVARRVGLDVIGSSFPGVPLVVLGQNRYITWGATFNALDVTDVYAETVREDKDGLSTVFKGGLEPIIPIPESYSINIVGNGTIDDIVPAPPADSIPPATLIVPRRNWGPILSLDPLTGEALSLQYTGFSGTRELEAFYGFNRARNLKAFKAALQYFDVGSQNFAYADIHGNIAYFTSAEMPLREDLQAGTVNGLPPFFIRYGQGGNEWIKKKNPRPTQSLPYEILPFEEMPQIVNPPAGYFFNANNDPIGNTLDNDVLNERRPGGGIFYLSPGYAIGNRAARIGKLLKDVIPHKNVNLTDMQRIQADVVMFDAQVFTPYILRAYRKAQKPNAPTQLRTLAEDARIVEAIGRLKDWDFSTPTGLAEGYDAGDDSQNLPEPDLEEIEASICTTIYSVWRAKFIENTIDRTLRSKGLIDYKPDSGRSLTALRHLLDNFRKNKGVGASGLDFFAYDGVKRPAKRRDIIILESLQNALDSLAGEAFAEAFGYSTDQMDYRWGRLHRIVFDHPFVGEFSIPPAAGAFPPPFTDLAGIATDGGFDVVDASSHSARADGSNDFMFGSGPVRRYAGQIRKWPLPIRGETILPGGNSGVPGSPYYANLLGRWLTNDSYPLRQSLWSVYKDMESLEVFKPKRK